MILKSLGSVSERASRVLAGVLLAVSLTTAVAVSPADALDKIEPVSVAVVDVQQIMRQSDAAKDIREQVESRRKVYEKDFQQREADVREAEKALAQQQAILANEVFQARVREHQQNIDWCSLCASQHAMPLIRTRRGQLSGRLSMQGLLDVCHRT